MTDRVAQSEQKQKQDDSSFKTSARFIADITADHQKSGAPAESKQDAAEPKNGSARQHTETKAQSPQHAEPAARQILANGMPPAVDTYRRPEAFKINGKELTLQGGFDRREPPELRKVFPAPDYKPTLVPEGSPEASTGAAPRSTWDSIKKQVTGEIGSVLGQGIAGAAKVGHLLAGDDWTNYGKDRSIFGRLRDLSRPIDLRYKIEKYNLQSAYPPGENSAGIPQTLACPASAEVERTSNGTCNDLKDPAQGAAGTRFQYNTRPDTRYGIDDPPLMETAKILARTEGFKELPVLNLLGAFNLQANVHDWMDHGKHQAYTPGAYYRIPVPADHPIAQPRSLGEPWMGQDVHYTLTSGDRLDILQGEQSVRTPSKHKIEVKQNGSFTVDGKAASQEQIHNGGKSIALSDGTIIKQENGMVTDVERNGREGKIPGQDMMLVPKLLLDGSRTDADDKAGVRTAYENTVTHWWDASEIYGSDPATADRLRTHQNGKMKLDSEGLLPLGRDGVADTGFNQNFSVCLEAVHTLYVREHNSICDMLTKAYPQDQYPQWKTKLPEIIKPLFGDPAPDHLTDAQYDQFIYSRARLINSAEIAKIHTVDWTPVALNNKTMGDGLIANYGQERTQPLSKIFNEDELGGIWGNKIHKAGVPYEMEEDFVQSYQQMHGLVPDDFKMYDYKTGKEIGDVPMDHALLGDAHTLMKNVGLANILYSMQKDPSGQIAAHNDPNFMRSLDIRGNLEDLTAIDILRGREKKLPRYNEYLREMHMPPVKSFDELLPDNPDLLKKESAGTLLPADKKQLEDTRELRNELKKVYNNDIEKVDTVIGSLAEWPGRSAKTMGFSGSTFLEFILMASRRVQADRFYTTDFRPEIYTPEGIARVRGLGGMKDVIDRNVPELKEIEKQRDSAFHPLGTGPIPLNNSGIDELPANDIQSHLAAFDRKHSGEVTVPELARGFEDIGYSAPLAYFKASMAANRFGSWKAALDLAPVEISEIKPSAEGLYRSDGNLDEVKVNALFNGKDAITQSDVDSYLKEGKMGFITRLFVEGQFGSAFKTVGSNSITRDQFERIMKGELIKQKIEEAERARTSARGS